MNLVNLPPQNSCGKCKHWKNARTQGSDRIGDCMAQPPQAIVTPAGMEQGLDGQVRMLTNINWMFPVCGSEAPGCGQFPARLDG